MWVRIDNDKEMEGLMTFLREPQFSCIREFIAEEGILLPCLVFLETEYAKPAIMGFAPPDDNNRALDTISLKEFLRGQKEIFSKKSAKDLHI